MKTLREDCSPKCTLRQLIIMYWEVEHGCRYVCKSVCVFLKGEIILGTIICTLTQTSEADLTLG